MTGHQFRRMVAHGFGRSLAVGVGALGAFYTLSNLSMPVADRRQPIAVTALVGALLLGHTLLYWYADRVRARLGLARYVAVQAAIVFGVGLTGAFVPVVLALYVGLTVETVITAGPRWGTMPITVGAIVLYGTSAVITLDLYRGATAGLVLAATGVLAHAIAALVRRTDRDAGRADAPRAPDAVVASPAVPVNEPDFDRRELARLTAREREVLRALTRGTRTTDIAEQLGITERTVKAHLASIYQKLGVESRTAAVAFALRDVVQGR